MLFDEMNTQVIMLFFTRYHAEESVVFARIRERRIGFGIGQLKYRLLQHIRLNIKPVLIKFAYE